MRAAWASRRARSGTRPKPPGDELGGSRTHCSEVDETATGSANSFGPIVPTSERRCLADRGMGDPDSKHGPDSKATLRYPDAVLISSLLRLDSHDPKGAR